MSAETLSEVKSGKFFLFPALPQLNNSLAPKGACSYYLKSGGLALTPLRSQQPKQVYGQAPFGVLGGKMDRPGYIYIIKADTGHYKIGRTCSVPNRLRLFSVKLPFNFEVIHTFPCIDMVDAERQLHLAFASKRVNGEWFTLTDSDIAIIKNIDFADWWREFNRKVRTGMMCGMPEIWEHLPDDYYMRYPYEPNHPYTPLPGSGLIPFQ